MATIDLNIFFWAARTGDIALLKYCLDCGVDIHSVDDFALRLAVENHQSEAVTFLLDNGANTQALWDTTIRLASIHGKTETVQKLLEENSCTHSAKIYAMYNAIFCGYDDIVKLLLQYGVSPTDNDGAVLKVVKLSRHDNIVALFEDYLK